MKHRSGKRKFAGRNMHIEFHTTNPQKAKASNCVYLSEDRVCHNKKSPDYLAKCFAASYCTFKEREKDAVPPKPVIQPSQKPKEPQIQTIQCTLPLKCKVYSNAYGQGVYTAYNVEKRIIEVVFEGVSRKFIYPDAIFNKHLIVPKFAFEIVLRDVSKAKKG